jgi:hypothetical protein
MMRLIAKHGLAGRRGYCGPLADEIEGLAGLRR